MKGNNKNSHLSAARQIPESNSLIFVLSVCPMVSVRGKTPIPMTPWVLFTPQNRQSELFKMEHVQVGNSIRLMAWDTGGNLSSLVCHRQAPSLSNTVKFLICPSVVMYPLTGKGRCRNHPPGFYQEPFCAGWFSPCFGTGHTNPLWEFQSEATIKHVVNVF